MAANNARPSQPSGAVPTSSGDELRGSGEPADAGHAHYLSSALLSSAGFEHAFFTRCGGVSAGPYASLNFSYAVGDEPQHVDENFRRAGRALGVAPDRLIFLAQVHGKASLVLGGNERQADTMFVEGDAVIGLDGAQACCVRTADCVPVLIADERSGCVAAVHAGWRGVALDIVGSVVEGLRQRWPRAEIMAAIGPHISVDAFEVSDDVAERLAGASPIDPVRRRPGRKPHVDLRAIARAQLERAAVRAGRIDDVEGCTVADRERFFSYRRDGRSSGRLLSAIRPRAVVVD